MSRRRVILLAVWVLGGWLTALVLVPRFRLWLEEHNQRTAGPAFGLANDVAMSLAAALDDPKRKAELAAVTASELLPEAACELTWTDREKTYVHAVRPTRAAPETAWRAVTVPGKAVLGRYSADLWAGDCRTPGADYESPCTKVERLRLVERREMALPAPATAGGATPLLPGQCALGAFGGKPGIIGRHRVTLPAEREITVRAFVLPATAFLSYRLTLQGKEAPHVNGENTVFRSVGEGEYDLEVTLLSVEGARELPGEYSLQVHWGKAVGP
ncbi:MAG: hypothetical protein JXP73_06785, partial [Deltaproteobacteria bacterium]|nr:hypothetical protein [Deltaproteobacteria bacterium]